MFRCFKSKLFLTQGLVCTRMELHSRHDPPCMFSFWLWSKHVVKTGGKKIKKDKPLKVNNPLKTPALFSSQPHKTTAATIKWRFSRGPWVLLLSFFYQKVSVKTEIKATSQREKLFRSQVVLGKIKGWSCHMENASGMSWRDCRSLAQGACKPCHLNHLISGEEG